MSVPARRRQQMMSAAKGHEGSHAKLRSRPSAFAGSVARPPRPRLATVPPAAIARFGWTILLWHSACPHREHRCNNPHPPRFGQRTWCSQKPYSQRRTSQQQRGLTPRSRRGPTAGHQARSGGTRYIFASPGLASHRRSRLTSNVRQRLKSKVISAKLGFMCVLVCVPWYFESLADSGVFVGPNV